MYARLITFTLGAGMGATAEKLADRLAPILTARRGLVSAIFFTNDVAGEYGWLNLWDSREDIDAEATIVIPRLQDALASISDALPTIRVFKVYEPRA